VGEGIDPRVRGELLHALLEGIWQELGDQSALLAMDEPQRRGLILRHWTRMMIARTVPRAAGLSRRQLERERLRAEHLLLRVLETDATRPPFTVVAREHKLVSPSTAGSMTLRIDRIDADLHGRWLIDYKSGQPEPLRLERGSAQPLQLALYEQALAQAGEPVDGLVLLSLNPVEPGYTGAAMDVRGWPRSVKAVPDWQECRVQWRAELTALLQEHVQGRADVTPLREACRYCHLAALCRRGDALDEDTAEAAVQDLP
jgi:ATP-dependent helicase/DNAse subunit B